MENRGNTSSTTTANPQHIHSTTVYLLCGVVGLVTGALSSFLFSATELVSDLKSGFCTTHPWLSRRLCCLTTPQAPCAWHSWGEGFEGFVAYTVFALCFATLSAWLVVRLNRSSAASGLPEVKTILGGSHLPGVLTPQTLIVKLVGLVFSVGSGLTVGTQGPLVHLACCVAASVVTRFDWLLPRSSSVSMVVLSAAAAAGVAVAFGSPIGGVLFSLEEASTRHPHKTMWYSFVCATTAAFTLLAIDSLHIGKFVAFNVSLEAVRVGWQWGELVTFTAIGIVGGLLGGLVVRLHSNHARFRDKYLSHIPIGEVVALTLLTSALTFPLPCMRGSSVSQLVEMFDVSSLDTTTFCPSSFLPAGVPALLFALCVQFILIVLTFGCVVPAGVFTPSLALGAMLGRIFAGGVVFLGHNMHWFPLTRPIFTATPNTPLYALAGSAAVLCGVTHMTVSLVVIMFELTHSPASMLPIMWSVVCSRFVSRHISPQSIFESIIRFRGYPFLNSTTPLQPDACAVDVMRTHGFTVVDVDGDNTLHSLAEILTTKSHPGFPVVSASAGDTATTEAVMLCHGYITRERLEAALAKARRKKLPSTTPCYFSSAERVPQARTGANKPFDLSGFLDAAPLQVVQHTPLAHIVDLFCQLDLDYCLVTHQGSLIGLIWKSDLVEGIPAHAQRRIDVRQSDWT